ncbi:MAG TPA: hypothetical protein VMU97_01540 [Candidatus Dormibacteraeota bacterium]|nr:hypothetical protein [Candidatus Dormibacteraeota bacterium]
MANTPSKTNPLSFAISYGFLGGPLHSRHLRKMLNKAGYVEAPLSEADIIIAHSGGAYLFNPGPRPKLILLAAPALTREKPRSLFKKNTKQLWRNAKTEHYLRKRLLWSLYGVYCALRNPKPNYQMIKFASDTSFELPEFDSADVFFIANRDDEWSAGPHLAKLLADRPWAFISLPGAHEHIWVHPEDYIDIIDLYAKRFLA